VASAVVAGSMRAIVNRPQERNTVSSKLLSYTHFAVQMK
jgi:hypothetical protein